MMKRDVVIVLAEDDVGHATLILKNLKRAGISNKMLHFKDGQETLDFFFQRGKGPHRVSGTAYILLLDIRMPKINGVEVLKKIKNEPVLCKIPIVMITTTDDPWEVEKCHRLGCSSYIAKPIDYENFVESIKQLGHFLQVTNIPKLNGEIENGVEI